MFDEKKNQEEVRLALAWQKGEKGAAEILIRRYRPLIKNMSPAALPRTLKEDFESDLALYFLEALTRYDPGKNPSFAGYMTRAIRWGRDHAVRRVMRHEAREELSLDKQPEGTYEEEYGDPAAFLTAAARLSGLTDKQRPVFYLWMQGLSPKEIQARTGDSLPSISRKQKRIKACLLAHKEELRELAGR